MRPGDRLTETREGAALPSDFAGAGELCADAVLEFGKRARPLQLFRQLGGEFSGCIHSRLTSVSVRARRAVSGLRSKRSSVRCIRCGTLRWLSPGPAPFPVHPDIRHRLLLELGGDFAFVGRQKRLRVGNAWYRVDLVFFHRALRCLVVIDLKVGELTHADAGQMHLYLNYAREHWVREGENPSVGLILCAKKDSAVAKYALEGLSNKVLAAEYKLKLPDERELVAEIEKIRRLLATRGR